MKPPHPSMKSYDSLYFFILWRLPKIEGSILNYRVPPLWLTYISERRTTFAKAYGTKVRCYVKSVG